MTTSVESDTEALRVLAGRATNLEHWGDEFAESCNEGEGPRRVLWSSGEEDAPPARAVSVKRGQVGL